MIELSDLTDKDGYAYRACWPDEYELLKNKNTADLDMGSMVYPHLINQYRPGRQDEPWLPMTNPNEVRTWLGGRKLIRVQTSQIPLEDYFVCQSPVQVFVRAEVLAEFFEDCSLT